MKILLDMNIPLKYADLLSKKDIECIRWSDVGAPTATDLKIIEYARNNDFVILTFDLDFSAILSMTHDLKPSIAQIRASVIHAEEATNLIFTSLLQKADDLKKGAILSIDLKKSRIRLLPL